MNKSPAEVILRSANNLQNFITLDNAAAVKSVMHTTNGSLSIGNGAGRQGVIIASTQYSSSSKSRAEMRIGDVTKGADVDVQLDSDALEQILGNLLSNVEKYAAAGKRVDISTAVEGQNTIITVADRGSGISRSFRKKIFEPFYRLSNSLTEGVSGAGIGLGISRELARAHGGDLTLEKSDSGARFKIVLLTKRIGE